METTENKRYALRADTQAITRLNQPGVHAYLHFSTQGTRLHVIDPLGNAWQEHAVEEDGDRLRLSEIRREGVYGENPVDAQTRHAAGEQSSKLDTVSRASHDLASGRFSTPADLTMRLRFLQRAQQTPELLRENGQTRHYHVRASAQEDGTYLLTK